MSSLFQFHKGTIKARFGTVSAFAAHAFQFHKGTIKATFAATNAQLLFRNFNSIKVQLKRFQKRLHQIARTFQFHKGTIKAIGRRTLPRVPLPFQFHKGTIKACS